MTSMPKRSASGRRTVSSAAHSATARTDFGLNYSSIRRRENLPQEVHAEGPRLRLHHDDVVPVDAAVFCPEDAIRNLPPTMMTASTARC